MIVVAGVTGHVGSVVAKELLDRKEQVKVLVRDGKKGQPWSQRGAEVAVGSLDDEAFLTSALRGARAFFTLLPPDLGAPDLYARQRQVATRIAGAVKTAGVPHVVLLSSIGADLADGTGPIKGLHFFEEALKGSGAKLTAVRATYFQENVANVLGAARGAGVFPSFFPADLRIPMIATVDVGHVVADAIMKPPARHEVVDVNGPPYTNRQVAEKLGERMGKRLNVTEVPPAAQVAAMTQAGIPKPAAESFAEMYAAFTQDRVRPVGDRTVEGKTQLDRTLDAVVGRA